MANYRITAADDLVSGGAKTKAKRNLAAIQLLKELEQTQRPASPEEQATLVTYSGWGAAADIFTAKPDWAELKGQLTSLLTAEEYAAARASTINAFYTEVSVVSEIYKGLEQLGFSGGRILDPSMGATGLFEGAMPAGMADVSEITGIELDSISGRIASQLYPDANIYVQGFQEVALADNYFDLSISNVPFSEVGVHDVRYQKFPVNTLHDYFFAKGLDKVRPGGLVAYITSVGTMQSAKGEAFRQYLGERANLVGAMRLPGDAFKKNAGTEVTTDLIILQKLGDGVKPNGIAWTELKPTSVLDAEGKPLKTNEYYAQRPALMLGNLADDKLYPGRLALKGDGRDLSEAIREAFSQLPSGLYQPRLNLEVESNRILVPPELQSQLKDNGYVLHEGQLMIRSDDYLAPSPLSGRKLERVLGLLNVRNATLKVFDVQLNQGSDRALDKAQAELIAAYDNFVDKNGYIHQRGNQSVFSDDPDYPLLLALERYEPSEKTATKTDIFFKRTIQAYTPKTHADSAKEGLLFSLNEKGRVDIPYIAELTSTSKLQVVTELQSEQLIFLEPTTQQWQTQDEYLSGNVKDKLEIAEAAQATDSQFEINVDALRAVQPALIPPGDIDVRLGATWIPSGDVEAFTCDLLGVEEGVSIHHSSTTDSWYVTAQDRVERLATNTGIYGTDDRTALQLIETTLNLKTPSVYTIDPLDRDRRILDDEATTAARLKQEEIKEKFKGWVWQEPERTERLTTVYNDTFNTHRERQYDGSHLELPGKNPNFVLRPHQRNAVYRSLFGNELLAHTVGAGKTATMVCAAMEQKRLGLANKPMFVVPNHMLEQFSGDLQYLYPTANILAATKKDSAKANRQKLMARISTGQWDAVVVTHTAFEKLKLSDQAQSKFLSKEFEQVKEALLSIRDEGEESRRLMKDLEKKRTALAEKIEAIANSPTKDNVVTFEQLGIDLLVVDESHYFKNLGYVTKMRNIAGLPNTNSNRAFDMLMKVQYLAEVRGAGKGVIFATGTPITNSMAELYTIQRYLQPEALERMGLASFDDWASVFGETVTAAELSPTGKFQVKTRFAEFVNMPELMGTARQVMDIQTAEMLKLPVPELAGGKPTVIAVPATDDQLAYMDELVKRAENMRNVDPAEDNMLKLTGNGRSASADMRLLDPDYLDDPESKTNRLVSDAYRFWQESAGQKTHLIFCDLGTPKKVGEFSLYQDIKEKLVARGIPEKEIAFAQDYKTDARKLELQKAFNTGKITILLAGQQLETGFNGQRKLARISHFTVPWRPDQVEQRDGRMIRQGNENPVVESFRYVTQGRNEQPGIEAYLWQMLENKSRFIQQAKAGSSGQRRMADISEKPLSYSEIKAIATGNPLIMEKATIDNKIAQLSAQKRAHTNSQYEQQQTLNALPHGIAQLEAKVRSTSNDLKWAQEALKDGTVELFGQILPLSDVEEAGKRIRSRAIVLQKNSETRISENIGTLGQFRLEIFAGGHAHPILRISGETTYFYDKILGSHRKAAEPLQDVLSKAIPERLQDFQRRLEIKQSNLAALSATTEQPFPKEQELLSAIQRQTEIHAALSVDQDETKSAIEVPSGHASVVSQPGQRRVAPESEQPDGVTQRIARFVEKVGLAHDLMSQEGFYLVLTHETTGKDLTIDSDGKQIKLATEVNIASQPTFNIEATFEVDASGLLSFKDVRAADSSGLADSVLSARLAHYLSVNNFSTEPLQASSTGELAAVPEPTVKDGLPQSTLPTDSVPQPPAHKVEFVPSEQPKESVLPPPVSLPKSERPNLEPAKVTDAVKRRGNGSERQSVPVEQSVSSIKKQRQPTSAPDVLPSTPAPRSRAEPPSVQPVKDRPVEPEKGSRVHRTVRPTSVSSTLVKPAQRSIQSPKVVDVAQLPRPIVEKARLAANYIGDRSLATKIGNTLARFDSNASMVSLPAPLQAEAQAVIKSARRKQQHEFAVDMLSSAKQLLVTAQAAGLTVSKRSEQGEVTAFKGQNYYVGSLLNRNQVEEIKVICYKTQGLVYTVDDDFQVVKNLSKRDRDVLRQHAELSSEELQKAVNARQAVVSQQGR